MFFEGCCYMLSIFSPKNNDRGLKTRKNISNAIRIDLYNKLDILSDKLNVAKSKLLDEAIEDLLKKYDTTMK